ncbi:F-box protein At3g07870-like [Rhododendron vialii]|uniref:F-box protein At3g07870-like n=1 Tax=Rhododendron vialii TaxID=182163 RepID=UPI00265F7873|nr:F-box protein At3g07870-like [Rhododendron vialii]
MEDLPLDISLNILKQLPITSLLSFKLVSKACYAQAANPLLAPNYKRYQETPNCFIIHPLASYHEYPLYLIDNGEVVRRIERPEMQNKFHPGPVLSTNGLLCLLFYTFNSYGDPLVLCYRACLCNPLTGENDFLPDPGVPRFRKSGDKERVFVDSTFGFGDNASTREYKVVGFRRRIYESATNRRYKLHAKVIAMGKKGCQWSEIDKPFLCPLHSSDIVVGNAIHWFCKEEEEEDWLRGAILSFHLSEEKFHQLPNPDCKISRYNSYLSVLGGCLVLTNDFFVWNEVKVHIWMLKEHGVKESWTKEFVIRDNFPVSLRNYGMIRPLFHLKSGKIVIIYDDEALYSYDPKVELFEALGRYKHWRTTCDAHRKLWKTICQAPSLVSPYI